MHASELPEHDRPDARTPTHRPERTATPGPEREAPADPGHLGSPADVLRLQRAAGNAAVTGALAARRHAPGAGHAPGPSVQRVEDDDQPRRTLANDQRRFGPGQLKPPRPEDQANLEKVFPKDKKGNFKQFPDPTSFVSSLMGPLTQRINKLTPKSPLASSGGAADWVKAINPQRDEEGGAYRRNCIDAVRSFLASWSGNPTVAAGIHDPTGVETGGTDRTKAWLNTEWRTAEAGPDDRVQNVWQVVAAQLKGAGHGAASIVVFRRKETGLVHAVSGVNHKDDVVWVDPQLGRVSEIPMYEGDLFMTITLDAQFNPVDAPAPAPTALTG
ncbi:toxin glutamine deamidase domain-containing protein [Streptomyces sp. TRM 70361]|uniref:toxin glutamine deamidase domain-containing protein n=1 Tax=Streptomyces sp. TRM 70361 TaxID=3116553 RepID=UPI002E7C050C|nr:toxin glutamine deamidase domain-containing protein [Streptomyces sp. TRM 70361]MEE1939879.1 toxin glutamine deamidase domain-containing protein [Streptomyces sp. TRM 70361]